MKNAFFSEKIKKIVILMHFDSNYKTKKIKIKVHTIPNNLKIRDYGIPTADLLFMRNHHILFIMATTKEGVYIIVHQHCLTPRKHPSQITLNWRQNKASCLDRRR